MSREIIKKLKFLKHAEVNPNEEWLKYNRGLLLSQIKNTLPAKSAGFAFDNIWQSLSIFLPKSFVYAAARPVLVLVLVLAIVASGWVATGNAAYDSVPGDLLYPAKRAAEKTQVALANVIGATTVETKLHVEFAKRRALETRKIVASKDPRKIKLATETVSDLKNEIKIVSTKLVSSNSGSAEIAKNVTQNTSEINDTLKQVKIALMAAPSSSAPLNLAEQVGEAKDLNKDTAVKAVEVMVAKHLQGDASVSKEEVKQAINNQLQSEVKDTAESKQNTEEAKKVVDVAQSEVKEIAKKDVKTQDKEAASSTQALANKIDEAAKKTEEAVNKVQQISTDTDKKASEAQQFLSQGNLTEAVDKVREASSATKEAEKTADTSLNVIKSVLPAVSVVKDDSATSSISNIIINTSSASGTSLFSSSTSSIINNRALPTK